MTPQQQTELETRLQNISKFNIEEAIAGTYSENIDTVKIGSYGASEIISLHDRIFTNFEVALKESYIKYLPIDFYALNGSYNILSVLDNYYHFLTNKRFDRLVLHFDILITYQIIHGFWDKSERKFHYVEAAEIQDLKGELSLLKEQSKLELKDYKNLLDEARELNHKLSSFYEDKQHDLSTLTQNATSSSRTLQEINELNSQAGILKEKINSILEQQTNLLEGQKSTFEQENEVFAKKQIALNELITGLEASDAEYTKALNFAFSQKSFLEEKREEIIKLTGLAADGSLGHTFNARSAQLAENVSIWRGGVAVVSILSIIWVVAVFYIFNTTYDPQWLGVIINILKTSPAFVLLGFAISQYNKERHLQEEYAFKAAVAMTISAYSDKISDTKKREELLVESTQRVYRNPNTLLKKDVPLISFGSKALTEAMKDVSESIKNVKSR